MSPGREERKVCRRDQPREHDSPPIPRLPSRVLRGDWAQHGGFLSIREEEVFTALVGPGQERIVFPRFSLSLSSDSSRGIQERAPGCNRKLIQVDGLAAAGPRVVIVSAALIRGAVRASLPPCGGCWFADSAIRLRMAALSPPRRKRFGHSLPLSSTIPRLDAAATAPLIEERRGHLPQRGGKHAIVIRV